MGKDSDVPTKNDAGGGHHKTSSSSANPLSPALGLGTINPEYQNPGFDRSSSAFKTARKAFGPAAHEIQWGPGVSTTYTDMNNPFYYRAPPGLKELPAHCPQNPMNLEMHLRDERQRLAGMTNAEREWRKKYVLGQTLHPDEPFYIKDTQLHLNPIRRIYRWPWDTFARKVLYPLLGNYKGHWMRQRYPKFLLGFLGIEIIYSHLKYSHATWDMPYRAECFSNDWYLAKADEIEAKHPGLIEQAKPKWVQPEDFFDLGYRDRLIYKDVGQTNRPW